MQNNIKKFLSHIVRNGDSESYVQLVALRPTEKRPVKAIISKDLDELQSWAVSNNNKLDIYFTTSAYSQVDNTRHASDKSNNTWRFKRSSRHTVTQRSYGVMDFDFKEQPANFQSPKALYDKVVDVLGKAAHMVVKSGGGVHIYYRLESSDYVKDFQLNVKRVFNGTDPSLPYIDQRAGLAFDDVLRLPFLRNNKRSEDVKIVTPPNHWRRPVIKNFPGMAALKKRIPTNRKQTWRDRFATGEPAVFHRFTQSFMEMDTVVTLDHCIQACAAFAQYLLDAETNWMRPPNDEYPVGTQQDVVTACSIMKFCELTKGAGEDTPENRKYAIITQMPFPNATSEWIGGQYDSVTQRRGCDTWSKDYKPFCKGCPYGDGPGSGKVKTPYGAAAKWKTTVQNAAEQKLVDDARIKSGAISKGRISFMCDIPNGFHSNGTSLSIQGLNDNMLLTKGDFRIGNVRSPGFVTIYYGNNYSRTSVISDPGNRGRFISDLMSKTSISFSVVDHKHLAKLHNDISNYGIKCLEKSLLVTDNHAGWHNNHNVFALYDRTLSFINNALVQRAPVPLLVDSNFEALNKNADADTWWDLIRAAFFTYKELVPQATLILASFASVMLSLMAPQGGGHIFNLIGPPGTGKTTALEAAASVWQMPARIITTAIDTDASMHQLTSSRKNLPILFDDMMTATKLNNMRDSLDITTLAHSVSHGVGRSKVENLKSVKGNNFQLHLLGTSNSSLFDVIDAKDSASLEAVEVRMTQFKVERMKEFMLAQHGVDLEAVMDSVSDAFVHSGAPGIEFVNYIMANKKDVMASLPRIRKYVASMGFSKNHKKNFWTSVLWAQAVLADMGRIAPNVVNLKRDLPKHESGGLSQIGSSGYTMNEELYLTVADIIDNFQTLEVIPSDNGTGYRWYDTVNVGIHKKGQYGWRHYDEKKQKLYYFIPQSALKTLQTRLRKKTGGVNMTVERLKASYPLPITRTKAYLPTTDSNRSELVYNLIRIECDI